MPYRAEPNTASRIALPEEGETAELWIIEWEENGKAARNHYVTGKRPYDLSVYRAWLSRMFRSEQASGLHRGEDPHVQQSIKSVDSPI